jgi:hypothetical protein
MKPSEQGPLRANLVSICASSSFDFVAEAPLGKIHYENVSLGQVIDRADLVVIADEAAPRRRVITMVIGKKAPPYRRTLRRYLVREVLRGDAGLVGSTLEIDGADWRRALKNHEQLHLRGLSKSPLFRRYDAPPLQTRAILFLSRDGDGVRFAVDDALEDPGRRDEILALL